MRNSFIGILCLATSWTSFGQTELTAKEAVFTALQNNYQVLIAKKQEDISTMSNKWSEAGAFPTVDLTITQGNTIQDNTNNPFTFTPGIILSSSINPTLNANWNIFTGFSVKMSKQRLEQLEQQSANNSMTVIESTVQDVLKAYFTAQLQQERMDLFQSVLDLSRERFSYYKLKEKYSTSNSLELLQFRNQYLTDSSNYLLQKISYDNSIRNLQLLMNDGDSLIDTKEFVLVDKMDIDVVAIDFEQAYQAMIENNSNLKNQFIALELQKTNTELSKSFLYPTLSFQAGVQPGWSWLRSLSGSIQGLDNIRTMNLSYYGNLNLRYTLFNNWKNKRAVEISRIQEEISQMNIDGMKKTLRSTLKNLVDLYQAQVQLVAISEENLEYAKKAYELAEKRFKNGSINSVDLSTFLNSYQSTLVQHYENLFNRMDTYLEIYKMTGKIGLEYTK